jgi:hypothetical protein
MELTAGLENTMNRICTSLLLATALLAGCASTSSLGTAADRLDSSAHRFYDEVNTDRAPGHTTNDAALLAEATRDFSRAVDRSRTRDELRPSFDRVAERYHHLRGLVDEPKTPYRDKALAFERVTEAYLDVDRAMNHPDSR